MRTLKVLLLTMLVMAIASPANGIVIPPDPADLITIVKEADREQYCPGETILYTITIFNDNPPDPNCGVTILQLIDILPNGETLEIDSLPFYLEASSQTSYSFEYYILEDAEPGVLRNEVLCELKGDWCNEFVKDASCDVEVIPCNPDFKVVKSCPEISKVGDEVCYTVTITNTGQTDLEIVDVNDGLCPLTHCIGVVLAPGEQCEDTCCMLVPEDAPNPLINEVEVEAAVIGTATSLFRSSQCETCLVEPDIDLEKTVEPIEACPGDTVTYTICIENTGDWPLENVEVEDPLLSPIYGSPLPGFPSVLFPGEVWCEQFPYTIPQNVSVPYCGDGALENCAEVTANAIELGNPIDANDCAEICCGVPPGDEGCTPGFWKNNADKQGASAWCDLFSPSMQISDILILNEPLVIRGNGKSTITDPTLLQALGANGGGVNAMIRHGVAAMLNACSDCVHYPINNPLEIILMIEDSLNGVPGAYTVDELHSMFAEFNEAGCPVNQHGECVGVDDAD